MSTKAKKENVLNYVKQSCDIIKKNIPSFRMSEMCNIKLRKDIDEFYMYFENAVSSSDPFIENVNKMREQGIWLPDKITDTSVKAGYFNLAKGYFYKVFKNETFTGILFRANNKHSKETIEALQRINKLLEEIIDGRTELE